MRRLLGTRLVGTVVTTVAIALYAAPPATAFCGFYVTKADTKLFNRASQVVLVRDGDRTVLTMANDFQGDPDEFAVVIPVPIGLERDQIHVGDKPLIDHLDAYTAPRLVEYFDPNPCSVVYQRHAARVSEMARRERDDAQNRALGVAIEASYTVGEYDIVILSAQQSDGLETWLRENGYQIPSGAREVLGSQSALTSQGECWNISSGKAASRCLPRRTLPRAVWAARQCTAGSSWVPSALSGWPRKP